MVDAKKKGRGESAVAKSVLVGTAISIAVTLIISAILAWLISAERLAQSAQVYGALIILLLASGSGALAAIMIAKEKRLIVAALSGLLYFVVLLGITVFCFGGEYAGVGETAAAVIGGSVGVALLTLGFGQKAHKGVKIKKYR